MRRVHDPLQRSRVYALLNGAKGINAMPQLDKEEQEILDPVVLAAMVEDPDEDEDTKQLRKDILGSEETVKPEDVTTDEDEDEENKETGKKSKSDDDTSEDEEDLDEDEETKKTKKPVEAKDDEEDLDEDEDEEKPKKTRKERRQERAKSFIDEIRKDGAPRNRAPLQIPDYKPVDYKTAPEDGFKPEVLEEDRERAGAIQFAKGAETVKYWAEQDKFWEIGRAHV